MPTHHAPREHLDSDVRGAHPVRRAAQAVSIVFLVVGILGFVPGITQDFDQLRFAGHESGAMLLGLFQVSVLHNLVHLAFGAVGLAMSRRVSSARTYLLVGGIIYLVLWLYGLLVDEDAAANVVPVNSADDWLHLLLGIGMIALALLTTRKDRVVSERAR